MVTISFVKSEIFITATALEGNAMDNLDDIRLQIDTIKILGKFRKSLRSRIEKAHISIIMDELQGNIPVKKRPLKKGG